MQLLVALCLTLAAIPAEPAYDPLGKGYLGVTVQTGGLTISSVMPDTPAAEAGFQPGDELVKLGELAPTDFTQVVAYLKSLRPGSPLKFVVRRGGEEKTLRAVLMARPASADLPRVFPE